MDSIRNMSLRRYIILKKKNLQMSMLVRNLELHKCLQGFEIKLWTIGKNIKQPKLDNLKLSVHSKN
jgi:hypothetical protein